MFTSLLFPESDGFSKPFESKIKMSFLILEIKREFCIYNFWELFDNFLDIYDFPTFSCPIVKTDFVSFS